MTVSGYNVLPTAGSRLGSRHSKDVLNRMRESQRANRKTFLWQGKQRCLYEIAEMEGMPQKTVERRVNEAGWTLEKAVKTPVEKRAFLHSGLGETLSFAEWVNRIGCTESFLRMWLGKGLTVEQCIEKHKRWTVSELARSFGLDPNMFRGRIKKGWSIPDAITAPIAKQKLTSDMAVEIRNSEESHAELAKRYGVDKTLIGHIKSGRAWRSA